MNEVISDNLKKEMINMTENSKTIAIYSRKSKFTGKGESIGNQIELCRGYIRMTEGEEAAEKAVVYEDEGFSGGNLNRPAFKEMMKAVKAKKHSAVIVYRLDRISRNISDFAGLIEELGRLKVDFISIRERFDTSQPMGRAMMYIASVFSQLERETIAERIRDNMRELAKTGRWLGGVTPTGYASESVQTVTVDGKKKKACQLTLIPEEAETVKLIYNLFSETNSLTKTETELMQRHIVSKNGKYHTRFSIKSILQNPVYALADEAMYQYFSAHGTDVFADKAEFDGVRGIMAYNRTDQEKGQATVYKPVNEWIVAVGQHPGLIPGKAWVRVQEALEQNKSKAFRRPRSNEALLTGFLFCTCGNRMYPKLSKRLTPEGKPVYTYVCKLKERSQKALCNNKNVNGNILDAMIVDKIKHIDEDAGEFMEQLSRSRGFFTGDRSEYEQQKATLQQEKAETDKKITGLVDALSRMETGDVRDMVAKRLEELSKESKAMENRLQELESLLNQHELTDSEFDLLRDMLAGFKDGLSDMSIEQQRAALKTVIRRVIWDGENAHVILFGACDDEIQYPEGLHRWTESPAEDEENGDLTPYFDIDYGETDSTAPERPWGEDSK